jgi:hypothetical protein
MREATPSKRTAFVSGKSVLSPPQPASKGYAALALSPSFSSSPPRSLVPVSRPDCSSVQNVHLNTVPKLPPPPCRSNMMSMKAAASAVASSMQQHSFDDLLSQVPAMSHGISKASSQPHRLPQQVAHGTAKYATSFPPFPTHSHRVSVITAHVATPSCLRHHPPEQLPCRRRSASSGLWHRRCSRRTAGACAACNARRSSQQCRQRSRVVLLAVQPHHDGR